MKVLRTIVLLLVALTPALVLGDSGPGESAAKPSLARQIIDVMIQIQGNRPGFRPVHAKGLVCKGTFTPSKAAAGLSKAAHFQETAVPIIVRFSDGSPDQMIPDNSSQAGPRGMAIRFLSAGGETDIVAMSHNGFVVATGEEFLDLQKSIAATDPGKPHPWPVEAFLGAHPLALKFVQENASVPASFATESFFGNNAFIFENKAGVKQAGRYQILPAAGSKHLTEQEAKTQSGDYLIDDLKARLPKGPVEFHLIVQLPNAGDSTKDSTLVWPEDRKTVEMGTISITSIDPNSAEAEKALAFDPTNLIDGIELSDDPLPALRTKVYALSVKHRNNK